MFAVCEFQGSTLQTLQKLMSQQSHVECMVRHIILEVKILLCSLLYQKLYFFGSLHFLFLIVSARGLPVDRNPKPFPLTPPPQKKYHLLFSSTSALPQFPFISLAPVPYIPLILIVSRFLLLYLTSAGSRTWNHNGSWGRTVFHYM